MQRIKRLTNSIRNRKKLVLIFIILTLGLLAILKIFFSGKQTIKYQTAKVRRGTIVASLTATGSVLSTGLFEISTQASGVVKDVFIKDGDEVVAGQKIAEIDLDQQGKLRNSQAWANYLSAKNTLDSANATLYALRSAKDTAWKKFYDLATSSDYQNSDGTPREDKRNSSAEFQSAQADWLAAEAKFKNQESVIQQTQESANTAWLSYQLSSPIITAPVSGKINLAISKGMVINNNQSSSVNNQNLQRIAIVKSQEFPLLSFNLTEVDIAKVKIGQKASITFDSIPGKSFAGKIVSVDRLGNVTSGVTNYPVIIRLDTNPDEILPNMTANATIILETKKNVLIVPTSAIQTRGDASFVRVIKKRKVQQVPVTIGISQDTDTEIISGVQEGDKVITGFVQETQGGNQNTRSVFSAGFGGGFLRPGGSGSRGNPQR
jgi:macrolide-specific efflux system membrane fusion protein